MVVNNSLKNNIDLKLKQIKMLKKINAQTFDKEAFYRVEH